MLKVYYSAGCILWTFCGAVILLLSANMSYVMYIVSVFIGIANALMMVRCGLYLTKLTEVEEICILFSTF